MTSLIHSEKLIKTSFPPTSALLFKTYWTNDNIEEKGENTEINERLEYSFVKILMCRVVTFNLCVLSRIEFRKLLNFITMCWKKNAVTKVHSEWMLFQSFKSGFMTDSLNTSQEWRKTRTLSLETNIRNKMVAANKLSHIKHNKHITFVNLPTVLPIFFPENILFLHTQSGNLTFSP